jgi:hypothetical protein
MLITIVILLLSLSCLGLGFPVSATWEPPLAVIACIPQKSSDSAAAAIGRIERSNRHLALLVGSSIKGETYMDGIWWRYFFTPPIHPSYPFLNTAMNSRSHTDTTTQVSTSLPFGSASAYNDTFPSPSSSSPLSAYRNRGDARNISGLSEQALREGVHGKGEAENGGLLQVTAETCYQLSLFKGASCDFLVP